MKLDVFVLIYFSAICAAQQPVSLEMNCVDVSNSAKLAYVCRWTPFTETVLPKFNNYTTASTSCPIGYQLMRVLGSVGFSNCLGGSTEYVWISDTSLIYTATQSNIMKVDGTIVSFFYFPEMLMIKYFLCSPVIRRDYQYMGCYTDNIFSRDLDGSVTTIQKSNNLSECIDNCKLKSFQYCGMQENNECYCGNSYGKYLPSTKCSTPCIDPYSAETCGGKTVNSIYRIIPDIFTIPCALPAITDANPDVYQTIVSKTTLINMLIQSTEQSTPVGATFNQYSTSKRSGKTQTMSFQSTYTQKTTMAITKTDSSIGSVIIDSTSNRMSTKTESTIKMNEPTTLRQTTQTSTKQAESNILLSSITRKESVSIDVTTQHVIVSTAESVTSTQSTVERNSGTTVYLPIKITTPVPRQVGEWTMWATSKCTLIKRRRNFKNPELIETVEELVTNLQLCDNLDLFYRDAVLEKQTIKVIEEVKEVKVKLNQTKVILALEYASQQSAKTSFGRLAVVVVITMFTLIVLLDVAKIKFLKKLKNIFSNKKRNPKMNIKSNTYQMEEFNPRRGMKNIDYERQILRQIKRMKY